MPWASTMASPHPSTCQIDLDLVRGNLFFLRIDPNLLRSNFVYECMNLCRLASYVETTAIADKHMVTNFFNVKFLFSSSESFESFEFAFSEWQKANTLKFLFSRSNYGGCIYTFLYPLPSPHLWHRSRWPHYWKQQYRRLLVSCQDPSVRNRVLAPDALVSA